MILQPNSHVAISVGGCGKYLIVRSTSAPIFIGADNLKPQRLETGDRINVTAFDKMFVENNGSYAVTFDYQISDLEMRPASTAGLVVQRIVEPITFEATVKVANGLKVEALPSTQLTSQSDIEVEPHTKVKVTNGGFSKVMLQVISDEVTELRVGDFNVSANCGLMLIGSRKAIGSLSVDFSGELFVYNASTTVARLALTGVK